MKIRNEPWAWSLLVVLVDLLLIAMILANSSCAHYPRPTPAEAEARDLRDAFRTAVVVETECGNGSGVLYDSTRVLTAHHVIDCDRSDKVRLAITVKVKLASGAIYVAAYDALDATRDLARLRLPSAVENVRTLTLARTMPGQVVCAVTSSPDRKVRCGMIDVRPSERAWGDIALKGMNLWFGNSGSPLYNTDGVLVGIVTRLMWCDPGDEIMWEWFGYKPERTCGGRASSVEGPVSL